jgi:hypothetical protein
MDYFVIVMFIVHQYPPGEPGVGQVFVFDIVEPVPWFSSENVIVMVFVPVQQIIPSRSHSELLLVKVRLFPEKEPLATLPHVPPEMFKVASPAGVTVNELEPFQSHEVLGEAPVRIS